MYIQVLLHSVIAKCIYRFIVYTGLLRLVGNAVYVAIDLAQLPPSATDIQRRPLLVGYRSLLICVLVSFDISVSPVENGVDFAQGLGIWSAHGRSRHRAGRSNRYIYVSVCSKTVYIMFYYIRIRSHFMHNV